MAIKHLYLAHPFLTRRRMRKWELNFERKFGIELHNPFYDVDRPDIQKWDENKFLKDYRYNPLEANQIVHKDLAAINKIKDGIIAYIDGSMSYGTIMEIFAAAKMMTKDVYLIVENGKEYHPWLQACATQIFTSLKDFEKWIKKEQKEEKKRAKKNEK